MENEETYELKNAVPPPLPPAWPMPINYATPVMNYADPNCNLGRNPEPTVMQVLFSPKGRIGRYEYWVKGTLPMVCALLAVLFVVKLAEESDLGGFLGIMVAGFVVAVFVACMYSGIVMQIKRVRDFNVTGWVVLGTTIGSLIPILGRPISMGMFVICGFIRGTAGWNKYGGDPRNRELRE